MVFYMIHLDFYLLSHYQIRGHFSIKSKIPLLFLHSQGAEKDLHLMLDS
uniref:Uncharacterized protein n=1 Tax=Klebsiella pneumoniae TaxID=573 RepID=A0A8B0SUV6_KLEPN|nr:hypothetical protein [Klebsiella pneumoniae]